MDAHLNYDEIESLNFTFPFPVNQNELKHLVARIEQIIDSRAKRVRLDALQKEIDWFTTAYENSAGRGYSEEYRSGFKAAIGWLRLHYDLVENDNEIPE